jgi:hypothetical protein
VSLRMKGGMGAMRKAVIGRLEACE